MVKIYVEYGVVLSVLYYVKPVDDSLFELCSLKMLILISPFTTAFWDYWSPTMPYVGYPKIGTCLTGALDRVLIYFKFNEKRSAYAGLSLRTTEKDISCLTTGEPCLHTFA